ncbi:MAG: hypothetical protein ACTXOO_05065 [Sodalis sp. (in: enterobacteria)]
MSNQEILLTAGYILTRLAMLDMFPRRSHPESMTLFIKRSGISAR